MERYGGIVLAGGRSQRMGASKAELPIGGRPLLELVAGIVARGVGGPTVVVQGHDQDVSALVPSQRLAVDARPDRGPLEGIAAGMRALAGEVEAVFVSAIDVPFLVEPFIGCVLGHLEGHEAAVPRVGGQPYPLSAGYRLACLPRIEARLRRDELRVRSLLDDLRVRWLSEQDLLADASVRALDPTLASLRNVNTPAEYEQAVAYENAMRSACE